MSKIRIKNFGPIKDGFDADYGFMDVKKVTVFIGGQGTGKSCVAKLISTSKWLEKAINRGEIKIDTIRSMNDFKLHYRYQGIWNYFLDDVEIEYIGEKYSLSLNRKYGPKIEEVKNENYIVPKIMYIPAERNFLSSVSGAGDVKGLPTPLYTFLDEFDRSENELTEVLDLPIGEMKFEYDQLKKTANIIGKDYRLKLLEASSGLHSAVPLYLVSRNLALSVNKEKDPSRMDISVNQARQRDIEVQKIMQAKNLSVEEQFAAITLIYDKFVNKCFINIVEKPEQNLFPTSQRGILNSLIGFVNMNKGNELIMTTHSPYIINYLTLAVKASLVLAKIKSSNKEEQLKEKLFAIVPEKSLLAPRDLVIYELTDDGKIMRLPDYKGLPSDENYLNERLEESNDLFSQLLDIEDLCQ